MGGVLDVIFDLHPASEMYGGGVNRLKSLEVAAGEHPTGSGGHDVEAGGFEIDHGQQILLVLGRNVREVTELAEGCTARSDAV